MQGRGIGQGVQVPTTLAHHVTNDVNIERLGAERDDRYERVAQYVEVIGKVLLDCCLELAGCADDLFARACVAAMHTWIVSILILVSQGCILYSLFSHMHHHCISSCDDRPWPIRHKKRIRPCTC